MGGSIMASRKSSRDPQSKTGSDRAPVEEPTGQRWSAAAVRVFISHNTEQHRAWAYRVSTDIEALGASAWLSSRDIPAGGNWQASIDQAFEESTHLIVLVGRPPVSRWVTEETGLGMQRMLQEGSEYKVIPVRVEADAPLTGRLSLLQAPDLAASYPDGLSALAEQLGLQEAMSAFQSGLLARWDGGYAVLRRHTDILSRQLSRMQRAVEDEQKLVDQKANAATASTAEAERLRLLAQQLDVRARNAAERAKGAAAEAQQAVAERERSQTILADLGRRMAEMEASHEPVIAKIDQTALLLEQAHRSGALSVDREGDVVSLLEDPTQLVLSVEPVQRLTFSSFQQELRLREALLSVVEDATQSAPEVRDIVLGSCLSAWATEVQPALPTLSVLDDGRVDEWRRGLASMIALHLSRRRHGYDVIEALDVAVATFFSQFVGHKGGPVAAQGAEIGIKCAEAAPPPERFDLLITNVNPELETAARDSVAEKIHAASKRSAGRSDVNGFFTARKVASGIGAPAFVLRGVVEQTAIRVAEDLKGVGVDVVMKVAES